MPRFVLLRHEVPAGAKKPSHWDWMLEWGSVLRTWELRELPAAWAEALELDSAATRVVARPLADHRLAYLDYEGEVSGGRGTVSRCDFGTYELEESEEQLLVTLVGQRWQGRVRLSLTDENDWLDVV